MKKTLIALTLATLPVAAMAEVVLYGQIKAGYEVNSTKAGDSDRSPYQNGIVDFGSRLGFFCRAAHQAVVDDCGFCFDNAAADNG